MRAKDIMSRPVYTVHPTDTIEQAAALLTDKKITAAPVLEVGDELVGMVSEGDLLWHRAPGYPGARQWRAGGRYGEERPKVVADVMSRHPVAAWPDADVADVAEWMLDRDVCSIPVVDNGDLVGIVSRRDILRTVVRTDDSLCREVQDRLDEYAGEIHRWTASVTDGEATVAGAFDNEAERAIVTVIARTVPGVAAVDLATPGG